MICILSVLLLELLGRVWESEESVKLIKVGLNPKFGLKPFIEVREGLVLALVLALVVVLLVFASWLELGEDKYCVEVTIGDVDRVEELVWV
jgi:hypothetical protein